MAPIKHGKAGTPLYNVWKSMRQRCNNPNSPDYRWYGALGIVVCDKWNDYAEFDKWASSAGYARGLTIDRIDCNKGYCPENCKWETIQAQQLHKRNRRMVSFNGETKSVHDWAEQTGISAQTIHCRLHKNWSIEKTLTTPNVGVGKYERGRSNVN